MISESAPAGLKSSLSRLPRELLESNGFLLSLLGGAVKACWVDELGQSGFNPYHYRILIFLEEGASKTQAAIADSVEVDRSQLVGLLDKLEESRLIERGPDPNDRRNHMVSLTGAGRRKLAKFRAAAQQVEDDFLAPLDAKSRSQLHDLLLSLAVVHDPRCVLD